MIGLIDTTEMYLRTIVELEEEGITPLRARIAERLAQSSPTVSQSVSRMERDGLVTLLDDRRLELSVEGRRLAIEVLRRHRLAELMLAGTFGMPLVAVHDEACRWEHVVSDQVERHIFAVLGSPRFSPFGCPIPGLEVLGATSAGAFLDGVEPVSAALAAGRTAGAVARISENTQRYDHLLTAVVGAGILPGAAVTFGALPTGRVFIVGPAGRLDVRAEQAAEIYLEA